MVNAESESGPPALCIWGPTGIGKTALALALAGRFPLEIVSVDSALVYRRMDIGTAKPGPLERAAVVHHLVDIREPWESYSAGEFRADARRLVADIRSRGRLPLLVGGTLLYFRALLTGLATLPRADERVRAELQRQADERGWAALHAELARVDPAAARRIAPGDRQRIQRALEVFRVTGAPISRLQAAGAGDPASGFLRVALWPADRAELYRRLDARLDSMLRGGLVAEVEALRALPLMTLERPSMRAVGYRQVWRYLAGETDIAEAQRAACVATRRMAKRQLTWMRSEPSDLRLELPAEDALDRVSALLDRAGVSRATLRCNMMGSPSERREHGV